MNPRDIEKAVQAMKTKGVNSDLAEVGDVILDGDSGCCHLIALINDDEYGYLDLSDGRVLNLRYQSLGDLRDENKDGVVVNSILK